MRPVVISLLLLALVSPAFANPTTQPIVSKDVIFEETGGMPAVEAEFFTKQTMNDIRAWYRITADETPGDTAGRDVDPAHLWQGKGRIAISSDGNHHDHDDWAATPMSLALLAARGLQDQLALYTYSDHVWGSQLKVEKRTGMNNYDHMNESALGGAKHFGFDASRFLCAVDDPEAAYNALASVINDSSADNPLFLIAGGPMQVVGEGIHRAEPDRRKHVTLISHSVWNNEHSDAGMIIYLLTGVEETEAPMARSIMETPAGN